MFICFFFYRHDYWSFVQFLKHYLFSLLQRQWMKIQCCYSNYHTGLHVLLHRHWSFLLLLIKDIHVLWPMSFVSWRLTPLRLLPFLCHSWYNLSDMMKGWEFFQWYACLCHQCTHRTSVYIFCFIIAHRSHIIFLNNFLHLSHFSCLLTQSETGWRVLAWSYSKK
jgi:hypothetical protein